MSKKNGLNIMQLIDSSNTGGAERMAINIANALPEYSMNSHLCITRVEGGLHSKISRHVHYLFLNKRSRFHLGAFIKLYNYIKANKIDLIHAHSSSYFMAFVMKLCRPKLNIIWHDHYGNSEFLRQRSVFPLNITSRSFKAIIAVNKGLKNWAEEKLKCTNTVYIPNFAVLNKSETPKTFLKGHEGKRIICLANLRPQKNHVLLIYAFKKVQEEFSDWSLHLVGVDLKDDYSNKIKVEIETQGLENNVFMYGSCTDVNHILSQAAIGVLSSDSEGLPVALLEYGLAGLPVVVTDVGECGAVVQHKDMLVESNNCKLLAEGLSSLINNSEKRNNLGAILNKRINLEYSQETYLKQLIKLY